jgi:O-antigen/teichoic acid export membrane protein
VGETNKGLTRRENERLDDLIQGPAEEGKSQLRARAAKATTWALLDRGATRTLTTVVFIILARLLTPNEFGIVALALVIRNFLGVFIDQGFSEAIVQMPDLRSRYINTAFWTAIATGLVLALLIVLAGPFIARDILGNESVAPYLRVLAISLVLTSLSSTQSALLKRDLAFRELAIRRVIAQVVAGVFAVVAALLGAGAWSIVLQTILQGGIGAAILWRFSKWRPSLRFHTASFRSLSVFGVTMVGIDILNVIQQQGDNFLVGRSLGTAALGVYALAFRFYFVVVDIAMSSMMGVALSTFARVQHDLPAVRRAFLSGTRLTALIALPTFAGIGVLAPEMIFVIVGDKWAGAVPVLRALCPSGLVLCLSYLDRSLMIARGRPQFALVVTAVGVALRLIGYVIGVQFGVVGVAVGLSVTSILYWPVRIFMLTSITGASLIQYARQLGPVAISTAVMVFALLLERQALLDYVDSLPLLGAGVLTGLLVYTISLALIDRASIRELLGMVRLMLSRRDEQN